jgi:hypothetical protein
MFSVDFLIIDHLLSSVQRSLELVRREKKIRNIKQQQQHSVHVSGKLTSQTKNNNDNAIDKRVVFL